MFDIVKKLKKSIKILMLVSAGIVLVFLLSVVARIFVLSIICAVAFIGCAIAIAIIYFQHESGFVFNENKYIKQISTLIKKSDSLELNEIAQQFHLTIQQVRHVVFECFKNKYIEGYTINGDKVAKIEISNQTDEKAKVIQCVGCGARFTSSSSVKKCPYCDNVYE